MINVNCEKIKEKMSIEMRFGIGIALGIMGIIFLCTIISCYYIVPVGSRGVLVTLGKPSADIKKEGLGLKLPFIQDVSEVSIRTLAGEFRSDCYTSDLQPTFITLRVLWKKPESRVFELFTSYVNVFDDLVKPRVHEAAKEVIAKRTSEQAVKERENVKNEICCLARQKIGDIVDICDIQILNIDLSDLLEKAIEEKMVQEQRALKAKFAQQQAKTDAETARIKAEGEANAIRLRSDALEKNPKIIDLTFIEKWDGHLPQVLGGNQSILNTLK